MQLIVHGQLLWTEREKWGEDGGVGNPEWHFNDEGKREGWRTHGGSLGTLQINGNLFYQ